VGVRVARLVVIKGDIVTVAATVPDLVARGGAVLSGKDVVPSPVDAAHAATSKDSRRGAMPQEPFVTDISSSGSYSPKTSAAEKD